MPDRMRMLETGPCADNFARELAPFVVVSDMFRTAEASLAARAKKAGVQPPSFSHHNYGRAIDLDVGDSIARLRAAEQTFDPGDGDPVTVRDKRGLDLWLAARGWFCFRGDHKTGKSKAHPADESWHFDFLGDVHPAHRPSYPYGNDRAIAWAVCQSHYAGAWLGVLGDLALGPPNVAY